MKDWVKITVDRPGVQAENTVVMLRRSRIAIFIAINYNSYGERA